MPKKIGIPILTTGWFFPLEIKPKNDILSIKQGIGITKDRSEKI